MITVMLFSLLLVGGSLLVGYLLGRTIPISRRDDLANELLEAQRLLKRAQVQKKRRIARPVEQAETSEAA